MAIFQVVLHRKSLKSMSVTWHHLILPCFLPVSPFFSKNLALSPVFHLKILTLRLPHLRLLSLHYFLLILPIGFWVLSSVIIFFIFYHSFGKKLQYQLLFCWFSKYYLCWVWFYIVFELSLTKLMIWDDNHMLENHR